MGAQNTYGTNYIAFPNGPIDPWCSPWPGPSSVGAANTIWLQRKMCLHDTIERAKVACNCARPQWRA